MRVLRLHFERVRRRLAERRATSAVEFAIIVPVMLLLAAGIVELGGLLRVYGTAHRLTMQYALSYADCVETTSTACQTELNYYTSTSTLTNVAPQLVPSSLTLRMFEVTMLGSTPTVKYSYPTSAALNSDEIAAAQANINNGQTGVIVSSYYQHTLIFFASLMGPLLGPYLNLSYVVSQLKNN